MLGYSKIQIMGNVGNVPEMKYLPSGDQVVNFSVAVNRRYKDRQGNPKEDTDWYRICAFDGIGTACAQFLSRGSTVFLEGRLQVRTYDSKNGEQVSVEIIPSVVRFLRSPRGAERRLQRRGLGSQDRRSENRRAREKKSKATETLRSDISTPSRLQPGAA